MFGAMICDSLRLEASINGEETILEQFLEVIKTLKGIDQYLV